MQRFAGSLIHFFHGSLDVFRHFLGGLENGLAGAKTYDVRSDLAAHDGVHSNHFCGIEAIDPCGKRGQE